MKNTAVVTLDTPSGPVLYKKLSARLEDFYNKYPVNAGYRVINSQTDTLSYQKGLLHLYETAVRAGHKPEALGLPSLQEQTAIVFESSLVGKDGDTIQNATAVKVIREYKDWEMGETAAFQRLLAKLGFGGEILDNDEIGDLASRGIKTGKLSDAPVNPEAASSEGMAPVVPIARPAAEVNKGAPMVTRCEMSSKTAEPSKETASAKKNENIPRSTLRQIERLAKMRGKEVPAFGSVQEALTFLLTLQNQGSDNKAASA